MKPYTIQQRAEFFNSAFPQLPPLVVATNAGKPFLYGFWFVGGGNVSGFYGSYQVEYLKRIGSMFPDSKGRDEVLHLFSGSLPPSEEYSRVGQDPTGQYKTDYDLDAHTLSSYLPIRPSLIYADPPYSKEDSEHYKNSMVNRPVVMAEAARVLKPGGYIVWMDQALPVFSNEVLSFVGCISYIRSTGNRFRCITFFKKNANSK